MTWSLNANGHNENNSEDAEKAILKAVVDALDTADNTVSALTFHGNHVSVTTPAEAKEKTSE